MYFVDISLLNVEFEYILFLTKFSNTTQKLLDYMKYYS